jgi:hypothetical protein
MDMQPGQVQIPHGDLGSGQPQQPTTNTPPEPVPPSEQPGYVVSAPAPLPEQSIQPSAVPAPDTNVSPEDQGNGWQYTQEADTVGLDREKPQAVNWTASEFVEHPKSIAWYGLLALAGVGLAAADYFVTGDVISTSVIVIAAVTFGVYASHKPRTQQYRLSPQGLQIGDKVYSFQDYKNFSVAEEGTNISIIFIPLKRFSPPLTIYVSMDIEERVLEYVSFFLPFEQRRADAIDALLRRIRF